MKTALEFLPANQDGSLELLLDCVDDFLAADHYAQRRVNVDDRAIEIRYYNELPLTYHNDNFLTSLHATFLAIRHRALGNAREEYHATFQYMDETGRLLYGNSYFVRRFAGHLLMSAQVTADDVGGWMELQQPDVVMPDLWHDSTEYDVLAFATQLEHLQRQVAKREARRVG